METLSGSQSAIDVENMCKMEADSVSLSIRWRAFGRYVPLTNSCELHKSLHAGPLPCYCCDLSFITSPLRSAPTSFCGEAPSDLVGARLHIGA